MWVAIIGDGETGYPESAHGIFFTKKSAEDWGEQFIAKGGEETTRLISYSLEIEST